MLAYNLFRHRGEHDLFCAVPEDFAVPAFLSDEAWEFTGKVDEPDSAPGRLRPEDGDDGGALQRLLFLRAARRPLRRRPAPHAGQL
jgi:hypothetical protein